MEWIDISDTSGLPLRSLEWNQGDFPSHDDEDAITMYWINLSDVKVVVTTLDLRILLCRVSLTIFEDGFSCVAFDEVTIDNRHTGESFMPEEVLKYMPIEP